MPPVSKQQFELLAPAGNWECAKAAVENGADAIYFGLETGFNARARAANFALSDLSELVRYLHLRGVRGYVTLNTLVFSAELSTFADHVVTIASSGIDAVLVQDLGAAALMRRMCPDLELHASTQMTITSTAGLQTAHELGIARSVLPRELAIREIEQLQPAPVGLEAFVHGALCVAYSGQCLTSESLGGRSANRGQCAQACRLPYDVFCDDEPVELGNVKYLLSPQDLAAHALLPDLIQAGVRSFKIEGRLKTPEYVANVTGHYRRALDAAIAETPFALADDEVEALELSFSRGFSPGWLNGCDHKMLVPGQSSAKRGVRIGQVVESRKRSVMVSLTGKLRAGDGVVFEGDRARNEEQGGRVFAAHERGRQMELEFQHGAIDFSALYAGQALWKTDDPRLTKRLRSTFQAADPIRRTALDVSVWAKTGEPLRILAMADSGATCEISSDETLPRARKHVCTEQTFREQLGRLGASVYRLRDVQAHIESAPMAPLSVLGRMRARMIEALDDSIEQITANRQINRNALDELRYVIAEQQHAVATAHEPRLHVLCRYPHQIEPAISAGANLIYVDFADIRRYREAVETAHAANAKIFLATPRIEKPGEDGVFRALEKHQADGILARNFGGLRYFVDRDVPVIADFSLNAANELSASQLMDWQAERVTVSYDLNRDQVLELIRRTPTRWLEVVIHQHMPMFHMEHCVFCAVLSPGTNKHNCGRPCDEHTVELQDRVGIRHPLHADVGCRNTLYNAVPQSAAEVVPSLMSEGVRDFRVELLENNQRESAEIIATYQRLLRRELSGREVWQSLQASNRVGVTRGALEQRRDPLAIL